MAATQRASGLLLFAVGMVFVCGIAFGAVAALTQPRPAVANATTPEPSPTTEPEVKPKPVTPATKPSPEPERKATPKPEPKPVKKPDPKPEKKPDPKPEPPMTVAISYEKQILPFFKKKCMECHGDPSVKGGLDLRSLAKAVLGGDTGDNTGAVAGNLDESQIWVRIDDLTMPPAGKEKLTAAEKQLVKDWILSGAK